MGLAIFVLKGCFWYAVLCYPRGGWGSTKGFVKKMQKQQHSKYLLCNWCLVETRVRALCTHGFHLPMSCIIHWATLPSSTTVYCTILNSSTFVLYCTALHCFKIMTRAKHNVAPKAVDQTGVTLQPFYGGKLAASSAAKNWLLESISSCSDIDR